MLGLFTLAGLFGAANPAVGAIVVSSVGGMLFMIGWLPAATTAPMVVVALFVSVLAYVGRRGVIG